MLTELTVAGILNRLARESSKDSLKSTDPIPRTQRLRRAQQISIDQLLDNVGIYSHPKGQPFHEDEVLALLDSNIHTVDVLVEEVIEPRIETVEDGVNYFRQWLVKEVNAFRTKMQKKSNLDFYSSVELFFKRRAVGFQEFVNWLQQSSPAELYPQILHQITLIAGTLWLIDTDLMQQLHTETHGDYDFVNRSVGQASVVSAITQEALQGEPEFITGRYLIDPMQFWDNISPLIPSIGQEPIVEGVYKRARAGSLTEIAAARGLAGTLRRTNSPYHVEVSSPNEDTFGGYDLTVGEDNPLLFLDVKSAYKWYMAEAYNRREIAIFFRWRSNGWQLLWENIPHNIEIIDIPETDAYALQRRYRIPGSIATFARQTGNLCGSIRLNPYLERVGNQDPGQFNYAHNLRRIGIQEHTLPSIIQAHLNS